ncbi:ABC transporter G family member 53 [Phytophthora cactorum]|nr:ABC transporter G family member 53 [Phytophthora cactorum]KAG3090192.1 ABC transporter G family member 53 [Phytophthora cactorum]
MPAISTTVQVPAASNHQLPLEAVVADKFAVPEVEICFRNLTISAEVDCADEGDDDQDELPTVMNAMRKMMRSRSKQRVDRVLLHDASGCIKPGTLTLVLGRPGSGKSTLLKALAGQLPLEGGNRVKTEGKIMYNGIQQKELRDGLPHLAGYVGQNDDHFATLTVQETLQFAYEFANDDTEPRPEQVIEWLGLKQCQDTILGDATALRGVSGGERKRVSLGEGLLGHQSALLLDEISTGLDAAATLDIISLLKHTFAEQQRRVVVVSLLQPDPEVFALFDEVLLFNSGEVIYYGPRVEICEYFAAIGLCCPQNRAVADFLLDIGTSQQGRYESTGSSELQPRQTPDLARHFRDSAMHRHTMESLATRMISTPSEADVTKRVELTRASPFPQSFWSNTISLTRRQFLLVRRDTAFLRARGFMSIVMGLIYGSTFFQASPTEIQTVLGLCFQAVLFLLLGQTAQIASFVDARIVLAKQRRAQLTRSASYVLACCAGQLPAALAETVVFGSITYWLSGLDFDASSSTSITRFLVFEGILFLTLLASIAWFFVVAAVSPDRNVAFPVAMASIIAFNIFAGFVVPKDELPGWLIWGYWIDPLAWSLRALAVTLYRTTSLDKCEYGGVNYCQISDENTAGEYYLSTFDVPSSQLWIPLAAGFLLITYFVFMILAWLMLERMCRRHGEHPTVHFTSSSIISSNNQPEGGYMIAVTPRSDVSTHDEETCRLNVKEAAVIPVTLGFEDLWYSVPDPSDCGGASRNLLKGVNGYAQPGTMTALMGSSGAGKTTLLDVLARRKSSGSVRGQIFLNGQPASELMVRRCTGYCEQVDIHSDGSTIREALVFSALLRQESTVSDHEKRATVEECLELLELSAIGDQMIRGRSREQLKRVSIGVELAARSSVLFLDEPTSGLDAQAAAIVMRTIRRAADHRQCTVVCTIHQPSANVFALFDMLLLLQLGGEVVYFGESRVDALKTYFQALPGAKPLPHDYNPATWILECVGAGVTRVGSQTQQFAHIFQTSDQHTTMIKTLESQKIERDAMVKLIFSTKRAASSWTQMRLLASRFCTLYWRTPSYSLSRLFLALGLGVIVGVLFSGADYSTYQGMNAGVGGIFLSLSYCGIVAINSVLPLADQDRAALYRERSAQSYNALWYFLGATLAEIPYVIVSSFIFTVLSFTLMGFTDGGDASWGVTTMALYWLVMALFTLQQVYLGQFLAYALPGVELASLAGTLLSSILLLFSGFNPPSKSIPRCYWWLHVLAPQRYTLAALVALVFADCSSNDDDQSQRYGCQRLQNVPLELEGLSVKQYVESVFEMRHDGIARDIAVSVAFTVGFQLLGLLSLRFVSHQRK